MKGACCLDLVPSKKRRETSAAVAKRIIRKRWLNAGIADRCNDGGTNVVFRKPGNPYVNCIFLDENDTVLASDQRGFLDIIRLPLYDGSTEVPRPLGQVLCKNLCPATYLGKMEPKCKLHSLQQGKSFAVGLASGELRVFATEHASLWGDTKALGLQSTTTYSQTARQDYHHSYVPHIMKSRRPLRKYQRDYNVNLSHQLQHPTTTGLSSRLTEVFKWNDPLFADEAFYSNDEVLNTESQWDFRETPSLSLQAVHIGLYADMFGLRVLDDRTPRSQNDICVDLHMENESDITAVCFVSDNTVASSVTLFTDNKLMRHSEIKLWDIRMIKNGQACANIVLPSYPRDVVHGMSAKETLRVREHGSQERVCLSSRDHAFPLEASSPLVSHLTLVHNGQLMVSAQFHHHFLIDPVRATFVSTVKEASPDLRSPDCTHLSTFAVDRQYGTVAIYEAANNEKQTIALHTSTSDELLHGRGRKRKLACPTSSKLETSICDCYGLQTELSCLEYNPSGTSLVGGSVDGDIFTWHAA